MPQQYATVRELLDDLHASYLSARCPAGSYGQEWVVIGATRCILPVAWLSAVGRPVQGMAEDWQQLSPLQAGLRAQRAYRVFHPIDRLYCGVVTDDEQVIELLEVLDSQRKALERRQPTVSPWAACDMAGSSAVLACAVPGMVGKVVDLRGRRA